MVIRHGGERVELETRTCMRNHASNRPNPAANHNPHTVSPTGPVLQTLWDDEIVTFYSQYYGR